MQHLLASSFNPLDKKFRFECETCSHVYSARPLHFGRHGKCKSCGDRISVPNPKYTIELGRLRILGVDFLKFRCVERKFEMDWAESSVLLADGSMASCRDVFPCNTNLDVENYRPVMLHIDDSLYNELKKLYPTEENLSLFVAPDTILMDAFGDIWSSKLGEQYRISLLLKKPQGENEGVKHEVLMISLKMDENPCKITKYKLGSTRLLEGYGDSEFDIWNSDGFLFLFQRGIWKIHENYKKGLSNDLDLECVTTTSSGILIQDTMTIPGSALERMLIYNVGTFQSPEQIEEIEKASDVIFYETSAPIGSDSETDETETGKLKIVYILQNQSMPGIVKIGRTTQGVRIRMNQLNTTGVALPYECFYAAFVEDDVATEKFLHEKFSEYRVNDRREFFEISPAKVMRELFEFDLGDATES